MLQYDWRSGFQSIECHRQWPAASDNGIERSAASTKPTLLPPEIIDRIVDFLVDPMRWTMPSQRRRICQCALTCRYWNSRIRPRMFNTVVITSSHNLDGDGITASTYIRDLHLLESDFPPWVHRAPFLLASKLQRLRSLTVGSAPPSSYNAVPVRRQALYKARPPSVLNSLPSLYGSFRSLSTLNFYDQHFGSFPEFLRLVGAIRSLRTLRCDRVTWGMRENGLTVVHKTARPPLQLFTGQMRVSEDNSCIIWLFVAPPLRLPMNDNFKRDLLSSLELIQHSSSRQRSRPDYLIHHECSGATCRSPRRNIVKPVALIRKSRWIASELAAHIRRKPCPF